MFLKKAFTALQGMGPEPRGAEARSQLPAGQRPPVCEGFLLVLVQLLAGAGTSCVSACPTKESTIVSTENREV